MFICFFVISMVLTQVGWADAPIDVVVRRARAEFKADVYAGWGFARGIVSHVGLNRDLDPRDYDLGVIGSPLSREEAEARAGKMGKVLGVITAYNEFFRNGEIIIQPVGFEIIVEISGHEFDFKFFANRQLAHTRGAFNVELILLKFGDGGIEEMIANVRTRVEFLREQQRLGRSPPRIRGEFVSDPYGGIGAWLFGTPEVVGWAKVANNSLEFAFRTAMLFAKRGYRGPIPEPLRSELIYWIERSGNPSTMVPEILNRAMNHKQSEVIYEMMADLGVVQILTTAPNGSNDRHLSNYQNAIRWRRLQSRSSYGVPHCRAVFAP